MQISLPLRRSTARRAVTLVSCLLLAASVAEAAPPSRLRADVRWTDRAPLQQTVSKRLASAQSLGAVEANANLGLMSLVLSPSATQNAALDQLLADQQNPSSSRFHQWLTPARFGEQFGVSDADLQILENWLTSQGFQIQSVAPSRNRIDFSGTAASAQTAFGTGFSRFRRDGQTFFSNTSAPTIPAAFSGVIGAVHGLSSYRLQPHGQKRVLSAEELQSRLAPDVTITNSKGALVHLLAPYDVRQIYSANALVSSGYTGTGVTIAVIGQTAVNTTQLGYFQTLTGQPVVAPTLTLVPNTGASTLYASDEGESESDIEFAGGVAPGAAVNFVYTGNGSGSNSSPDVLTALVYAITNNIGQIITLSYGECEGFSGTTTIFSIEPYLRQASAQGQTFVNSSGDSGAAACDSDSQSLTYDGAAVSYPSSSPYVTAVGGTFFNEGAGTYWTATNNSQRGSALSYIPETAWNESSAAGIGATGGGASLFFSKPSWQTGTGVPADGARDVPDIAFAAAAGHDPYIVCTADPSFTGTATTGATVTGNCTPTALSAFVIGGTSLSTPSFAGMLALAEQANGGGRLGNLNPTLYALAASNGSIFNDVVGSGNQVACIAGTIGCVNGTVGFAAVAGYDEATGLGSINIGTFSAALKSAATVTARTPTVSITQSTASTATTGVFVVTVASSTSTTVPTGTVSVTVDGGTATSLTLLAASNAGAATFTTTLTGLSSGTHTVVATYNGDSNYSTGRSAASFLIGSNSYAFSLAAAPASLTVTSGLTGSATVSLTSTNYTGLVLYSITPASGSAAAPGCFIGGNGDTTTTAATLVSGNPYFLDAGIAAGSTVTAGFTYHSLAADCGGSASNGSPAEIVRHRSDSVVTAVMVPVQKRGAPWAAFAFGGCVLGGLSLRRRKSLARVAGGGLLAVAFTLGAMGVTGCGSGTSPLTTTTTTTTSSTPKIYNYVITAQAFPSGSVSTTTNFTLTVQ